MNRITKTFSALKSTGRTALMPYLTMGYPEKDSALS
ncbi:MAG: tryptophan synthase subunit alpha, partial [Anaerolineales bacterium]